MSSTEPVPETRMMPGDQLSADDALHALYHYGRWPLLRDAFVRFRYGDGFSHSRALALQLCLAIVPFLIALSGLATDLGAEEGGQVVADTVVALTPGNSDPLVRQLLETDERTEEAGEFALVVGLITGLFALTQAMAQIERGANRIYGVERDRPAVAKYTRATLLACSAGIATLTALFLLVAGGKLGDAVVEVTGSRETLNSVWEILRWPLGAVLVGAAITLIFKFSPRRPQPSLSWLALGAGLAVGLWIAFTALLAAFLSLSRDFGDTYGPLAGLIGLLLWTLLSALALFGGLAVAAQLEALRGGAPEPAPETG